MSEDWRGINACPSCGLKFAGVFVKCCGHDCGCVFCQNDTLRHQVRVLREALNELGHGVRRLFIDRDWDMHPPDKYAVRVIEALDKSEEALAASVEETSATERTRAEVAEQRATEAEAKLSRLSGIVHASDSLGYCETCERSWSVAIGCAPIDELCPFCQREDAEQRAARSEARTALEETE